MTSSPLDPGRRAQVDPVLAGVFGELDASARDAIAAHLQWLSLPGGATLFGQGDHGDDVYLVVNGRLRSEIADAGGVRVLEEAGRGAAIGELGLLTGETRAASVVAIRDSDLVRLPKAGFDARIVAAFNRL